MIRCNNILVYTTVGVVILLLSVVSNPGIAQTEVIGFIEQDTTWAQANSPYRFAGPIVVNKGITLTIESDVTVDMNGHDLTVNGALIAKGADSRNIKFVQASKAEGKDISLTSFSMSAKYDDNGNYLSGSILQYCTLESFSVIGAPYINHCEIKDGSITISGDVKTVVISHTKIDGGIQKNRYGSRIAEIVLKNNVCRSIEINEIRNVTLSENTISGGGIEIERGQTITLKGNSVTDCYRRINLSGYKVTLLNNVVRQCGGIDISGRNVTVQDNTIAENSSDSRGGGLSVGGGVVSIKNNTISGNTGRSGGGIYVSGGSKIVITHNKIVGNRTWTEKGGYGGGIMASGEVVIAYNTIIGNTARNHGGGISISYVSSAIIENNIIAGNSAYSGGGLFSGSYRGIYSTPVGEPTEVTNNTITNNYGIRGAAMSYFGDKKITGNIISNNNKGKGEAKTSAVYLKYSKYRNPQKILIEGNPVFTRNVITDNATDVAVDYKGKGNFNAKNNYWGATEKAEVLKTHDYLKIDAVPFLTESPVPVGSLTVDMKPKALSADGTSTAIITVALRDSNNNPMTNEELKMVVLAEKWGDTVVDTEITGVLSEVQNKGDGTYTTIYTASKKTGPKTIWVAAPKACSAKSFDVTLLEPVTYNSRLLKMPSVKARAGKNVLVSVTIDDLSSVAKIDVNLDYNPKPLVVKNITQTTLTKDSYLTTNTESAGKASFSLSNSKGIADSAGSLVNIEFQVKEEAPHEATPIKFESIFLYDEFGRPIPFSHADGSILIKGGTSLWIFVGIAAVVVVALILVAVVRSKRKPQAEGQS